MSSMALPALTIRQLTCSYDSVYSNQHSVLQDLNLTVEQGEIVCLLGVSGCGKTTLLKAIAGLLPLSKGQMQLKGNVIDDGDIWLAPEKRNIGMIFQDYALFPHLTVADNIAFGLTELAKAERNQVVEEMLQLVHLTGLAERYPHQLSGGQQQRVAIARSLAYQPDLLLLDEPFSNIDTQVRHDLIRDIRAIFKQQEVTAIFVTHSREEAFAFADKMAVMNQGVIEQFGSAAELYYQPSSQFVANFLGGGAYLPAQKLADNLFDTVLGPVELLPSAQPQAIEVGQACQILLRPQQVSIQVKQDGEAKVIEQQFMGDHCRYLIDVEGVELLAQSNQQLDVGQSVSVKLDIHSVSVFA